MENGSVRVSVRVAMIKGFQGLCRAFAPLEPWFKCLKQVRSQSCLSADLLLYNVGVSPAGSLVPSAWVSSSEGTSVVRPGRRRVQAQVSVRARAAAEEAVGPRSANPVLLSGWGRGRAALRSRRVAAGGAWPLPSVCVRAGSGLECACLCALALLTQLRRRSHPP